MPTLDNQVLSVAYAATLNNSIDLQTVLSALSYSKSSGRATGTGSGQADRLFSDTRTIAASSNDDLDLAGVLVDPLGATLTFARVKTLIVKAASANANTLIMGGAASNPVTTILGGTTPTLTLRPDGLLVLDVGADATGYAVTAATADILRFTNGGAGSSVTYDVIIVGSSA
jgi:hypothetical protein